MLWLILIAFARPPANPTDEAEGAIVGAQERIDRTLRGRGYLRVATLRHRTYYIPVKLWKPRVMVHEEGFARIRGTPVYGFPSLATAFTDPSQSYTAFPGTYSNPTAAPIKVPAATFITQGRRAVQAQKTDVARALMPLLSELQDARAAATASTAP